MLQDCLILPVLLFQCIFEHLILPIGFIAVSLEFVRLCISAAKSSTLVFFVFCFLHAVNFPLGEFSIFTSLVLLMLTADY